MFPKPFGQVRKHETNSFAKYMVLFRRPPLDRPDTIDVDPVAEPSYNIGPRRKTFGAPLDRAKCLSGEYWSARYNTILWQIR